ncbi:ABC transporter ATP-binding protein, partial [Leifsonia sp. SIMBA_070]
GFLIDGSDGAITAGTIVAFTTVQARVSMPLVSLMRVALEIQTSQALFARIFEYLDLKPAIVDRPQAIAASAAPGPHGRIEFRDVRFR